MYLQDDKISRITIRLVDRSSPAIVIKSKRDIIVISRLVIWSEHNKDAYILYIYIRVYRSPYYWLAAKRAPGNDLKIKHTHLSLSRFEVDRSVCVKQNKTCFLSAEFPSRSFATHIIVLNSQDSKQILRMFAEMIVHEDTKRRCFLFLNDKNECAMTFFLLHWDYESWIIHPAYPLSFDRGKRTLLFRMSEIHLRDYFCLIKYSKQKEENYLRKIIQQI